MLSPRRKPLGSISASLLCGVRFHLCWVNLRWPPLSPGRIAPPTSHSYRNCGSVLAMECSLFTKCGSLAQHGIIGCVFNISRRYGPGTSNTNSSVSAKRLPKLTAETCSSITCHLMKSLIIVSVTFISGPYHQITY